MTWLRSLFAGRPIWINALMVFCGYMTFIYLPWDLFVKPVAVDQEVWFGILFTGWGSSLAQEAYASLEAYFQEYLEDYFRMRPLEATQLGEHRFDHLLEDLSAASRARWTEHARKTLAALPRVISIRSMLARGMLA